MDPPNSALAPERTVIVVDDDLAVLGSLKFALELEGFSVRTYASAKAVLADHREMKRACLLVDQNLADGEGLQVLSELRRRGVAMPAILITTDPGPQIRKRAAEAGVAIVEKPLLGHGLIDAVRGAFLG